MGLTVMVSAELSHSISGFSSICTSLLRWCAERIRITPSTIMKSRKPTHTTMMMIIPSPTNTGHTLAYYQEDQDHWVNVWQFIQRDSRALPHIGKLTEYIPIYRSNGLGHRGECLATYKKVLAQATQRARIEIMASKHRSVLSHCLRLHYQQTVPLCANSLAISMHYWQYG